MERPRYFFTRHARNRMRWYDLTEQEVVAAVEHAGVLLPDDLGHSNAWARRGEEWLRVTHVVEGSTIVIVTVTLTARGPGRRRGR